ncbi:MAG: hypothetical protein Q8P20_07000 [bacterium]|nr:hypothetical protein [bacterium]
MTYLQINKIISNLKEAGFQIFTLDDFAKRFKLPKRKATLFLSRNIKKNYFTRIKNGLYYLTENPPAIFNIANISIQPSYISIETALSYYNIIPETIYSITSMTTKHSKSLIINNQEYKYHKLSKKLYFGYVLKNINGYNIFIAEKEKALLDYIYYIARGNREMNDRINLKTINRSLLIKHFQYFKKEINNKLFVKKMELIIDSLK